MRGKRKGRVISADWYDGAEGLLHPRVPTLCIALEGGTVQIGRGVDDTIPVLIDAHMTIRQVGGYRTHRTHCLLNASSFIYYDGATATEYICVMF